MSVACIDPIAAALSIEWTFVFVENGDIFHVRIRRLAKCRIFLRRRRMKQRGGL